MRYAFRIVRLTVWVAVAGTAVISLGIAVNGLREPAPLSCASSAFALALLLAAYAGARAITATTRDIEGLVADYQQKEFEETAERKLTPDGK